MIKSLFQNEKKELQQKIPQLVAILFVCFSALILTRAFYEYITINTSNPYVNTIEIPLESGLSTIDEKTAREMKSSLESKVQKEKIRLNQVTLIKETFIGLKSQDGTVLFGVRARTLLPIDSLYNQIIKPENLMNVRVVHFNDSIDLGVIVTQSLLKDLGYSDKQPFFLNYVVFSDNQSITMPLPVKGIVKSLPGKARLIHTPYLYNYLINIHESVLAEYIKIESIDILLPYEFKNDVVESTIQFYAKRGINIGRRDFNLKEKHALEFSKKISRISLDDNSPEIMLEYDDLIKSLNTKFADGSSNIITKYFPPVQGIGFEYTIPNNPDILSINFESIEHANFIELKQFLRDLENPIELEQTNLEQIKFARNVKNSTDFIFITVLIFSVFILFRFLTGFIQEHFIKIRRSLGNFRAFGLSKKILVDNYMEIIIRILVLSIFISSVSSVLASWFLLRFSLDFPFSELTKPYYIYLSIFIIIVLSLVLFSWFIASVYVNKELNKRPGELIYDKSSIEFEFFTIDWFKNLKKYTRVYH